MFTPTNPRYVSPEDAQSRLNASFMMVHGKPAYMQYSVNYIFLAHHLNPRNGEEPVEEIDVRLMDFEDLNANLPLGFVNICSEGTHEAHYLTRRAGRQNKEGVCDANLFFLNDKHHPCAIKLTNRKSHHTMYQMFANEYPSIKESLQTLAKYKAGGSIAFNRGLAIRLLMEDEPRLTLVQRNNTIGFIRLPESYDDGLFLTLLPPYSKDPITTTTLRSYNFIF
jgi:hypothetical protein